MIAEDIDTLRPRQNGYHFADDSFKCIFLNENIRIAIEISLKFAPKGPIYNIPALVQIRAWRRPGDKPLSEPTMLNLLSHICVTRPQWVDMIAGDIIAFIWAPSTLLLRWPRSLEAQNAIAWPEKSKYIYDHDPLHWRHNERDGVSNHQPHDSLLNVNSGADQRKHHSAASLAFVWGVHLWPVNSPHKGSVTRKVFPFDDVIMLGNGMDYSQTRGDPIYMWW